MELFASLSDDETLARSLVAAWRSAATAAGVGVAADVVAVAPRLVVVVALWLAVLEPCDAPLHPAAKRRAPASVAVAMARFGRMNRRIGAAGGGFEANRVPPEGMSVR
jgi:hypothetical protein